MRARVLFACRVGGGEGGPADGTLAACPRVYVVPRTCEKGEADAWHLQPDRAPLDAQGAGKGV